MGVNTGLPMEFEWMPSTDQDVYPSSFNPKINLGGVNVDDPSPSEPGLDPLVVDLIKEQGPILIDTQSGKYTFTYEERKETHSEPHSLNGTYSATQNLISVRKVHDLEDLE